MSEAAAFYQPAYRPLFTEADMKNPKKPSKRATRTTKTETSVGVTRLYAEAATDARHLRRLIEASLELRGRHLEVIADCAESLLAGQQQGGVR